VARPVADREVPLEQLLELLVELKVRPACSTLLELSLAPALGPQEHRGEEVPPELRGLRTGRPLHLHAQRLEQGVEGCGVRFRHTQSCA
jgi:hypothetical protein